LIKNFAVENSIKNLIGLAITAAQLTDEAGEGFSISFLCF